MSGDRPVFDVCGDLPTGTTLLEASAGTGKTFTIAALATRYVAEGRALLPQLLLVTFGRAATSELRDRVRERLVSAERALREPALRDPGDALVAHLCTAEPDEVAVRARRLTRALADFDAATIATTHGFCQQVLVSLGVAGDVDRDAVLVPDIADLVDEVVDDLYLQRYAGSADPVLTPACARSVGREAVRDPQAVLEPSTAERDSEPGHRYAFATAVRVEVLRRKRDRRVLDYDDLLAGVRDVLADPVHGEAAAERVRSRYAVVMVDEFQDTDPVQWQILQLAFHGSRTLVLIGDPKQAIYAFRGGDVVTYLSAADEAGATATLGRSWRSDAPLLTGLDHVLRGAALGDDRIRVVPVEAEHRERRLEGGAPVRLRRVTRAALGLAKGATPSVDAVRALIASDVAADVVRSLDGGTRIRGDGRWEPLRPGDVAVLARRNADAALVRRALVEAGVPAVESGLASVFGTPAARHWLTLLATLEQPGVAVRAAALALTPFVGWDATRLAGADDARRDALADRVRGWSHLLSSGGVAALSEAVTAEGLSERLLRTADGERVLTDLRHVGQALHAAGSRERLGASALTEWLRRRIAEAGDDYAEERSRRLESDAAAVQVVTVHASKGLEFPVVYVPYGWDRYESRSPAVLAFHDDSGIRYRHVGGPGSPHYDAARDRHVAEERGEDLRLLYVALTRARSQVVAWWAPTRNSAAGPLSRVLLGDHPRDGRPPGTVPVPRDDAAAAAFAALAAASEGTVAVEDVPPPATGARWTPAPEPSADLTVARFERRLDLTWRRTSYTGLTAAAHDAGAGVSSEPEQTGVQDEADAGPATTVAGAAPGDPGAGGSLDGVRDDGVLDDGALDDEAAAARDIASPMADLPAGAAFGTLVHGVLERVDTSAADPAAELLRRCREAVSARVPGVEAAALADALGPVLATPVGPLADGRTLLDVPPSDRLAELEFELPLAGGDDPSGRSAALGDVAALLSEHVPPDDPFGGYAARLGARELRGEGLRGYLTGSLDAVLRVPGENGPRYLVVDYKTNWLGAPGEPLTAWHYRPDAMVQAMLDAHYPLQLLLYCVALHRFLRWRQSGYDPDVHLGGGLYLFVRGMCGPATPVVAGQVTGVAAWRPPTPLVVALSALLDGGTSGRTSGGVARERTAGR